MQEAGDLDGDGRADIATSKAEAFSSEGAYSRALAYAGAPSGSFGDAEALFIVNAPPGSFVVAGGASLDLNGDGQLDFVAAGDASGAPTVWVFFGPVAGAVSAADADASFAGSCPSVVWDEHDLNADGYEDLPGGRVAPAGFGFFAGPLDVSSAPGELFMVEGPVIDGTDRGVDQASVGDFNGDGALDLASGAAGYSTGNSRVAVFLGPLSGTSAFDDAPMHIESAADGMGAGRSVSMDGDLDGDGDDDLVVGAPSSGSVGVALLFADPWVGTRTTDDADLVLAGVSSSGAAGWSIASNADVSGDGRDDLVVRAPTAERVWVIHSSVLQAYLQ